MALLHLSSSPSPRTLDNDQSKHVHGQVSSTPLKQSFCPQKSKRMGAFSDKANCKDVRFDEETIAACIHGYGEHLHANRGCIMETLTMRGLNLQVFGNPNGYPANPYKANANPNLFNANPNGLNISPNLMSNNLNGFNVCSCLSFNGGDGSGKGLGSGGHGGGSGGHSFGHDGNFDWHRSGLAILGMHTFFEAIDEGKFSGCKAAFDHLNSLFSTLVSMQALAGVHPKGSIRNKEAFSGFTNVFELESDHLDHNPRTEVDDQDTMCFGQENKKEIPAIAVADDHAMHRQNITGLSAHNVHALQSLLNDGFIEKVSEKTRDVSHVCNMCSSQTNFISSDISAEMYRHYQRLQNFLASACRDASLFGWKLSEENYNVSTQIDVMDGDVPSSEQDGEIQVDAWDLEGAMDRMVFLPESEQNMKVLPFQTNETPLDADVSLQKHKFSGEHINNEISSSLSSESSPVCLQTAAHHEPQGAMGWLGQLAHPAIAMQAGDRKDASKAKQVPQHESRVSSIEGVPDSLQVDCQASKTPIEAKKSDVDALKRLQRETFSELMKLRDKLDKLEQLAQARQKLDKIGAARTHLHGQVKAGTAFVLLEDRSSRHARDALEQAGMQTGLDVKFTFETPFREKDVLITQCLAGQGSSVGDGRALGGPLNVGKLQYVAHVNDDVSFSFVPLGAQGKDVTEIINVLQDEGLTAFSSQGPALFNHCKGSALGATVSGSRFAFSLAQYLSGWGNHVSAATGSLSEEDPLCLSTLGQFLLQPTDGFILALAGLNRYWPSPPPPSSMALHWSEMGPLVIPKFQSVKENRLHMSDFASNGETLLHMNRTGSHWENPDLEYGMSAYRNKGAGMLSLAVASSLDLSDNLSVSGWAEIGKGEMSHDLDTGNVQWALSIAKASESGISWGASIGGSRPDIWSMSTNYHDDISGYDGDHFDGPQLHAEAFIKLSCGRGFTLQPGLLYVSNKHSRTPAFVVRSSWSL